VPDNVGYRGYPTLATIKETALDKTVAKKTLEFGRAGCRSSLSHVIKLTKGINSNTFDVKNISVEAFKSIFTFWCPFSVNFNIIIDINNYQHEYRKSFG
jgi:hypothetical protein